MVKSYSNFRLQKLTCRDMITRGDWLAGPGIITRGDWKIRITRQICIIVAVSGAGGGGGGGPSNKIIRYPGYLGGGDPPGRLHVQHLLHQVLGRTGHAPPVTYNQWGVLRYLHTVLWIQIPVNWIWIRIRNSGPFWKNNWEKQWISTKYLY